MIHHIARKRGAERGTDAHCATHNAEPKIEPSSAAHDVRNHKRENHAEDGGTDAIENLDGHYKIRTAHECKEYAAQCQGRKTQQQ